MKWPTSLTIVRHGQSAYNVLRGQKQGDPDYQRLQEFYQAGDTGPDAQAAARLIQERYALGVGDYETPMTKEGHRQARLTGEGLWRAGHALYDVILYSPYLRTRDTRDGLIEGWPELGDVPQVEDDRIREQEHGLAILYNDWRVFHTFHPEQRALKKFQGNYWYQYPQGESVANVRDRVRSMMGTLVREYRGQRVLMVTHHLTILSIRANLERLTPEEFLALDRDHKPINLGVTVYDGRPGDGSNGRLELTAYNQKFY